MNGTDVSSEAVLFLFYFFSIPLCVNQIPKSINEKSKADVALLYVLHLRQSAIVLRVGRTIQNTPLLISEAAFIIYVFQK
jgi:hypothetical protein